MQDAIMNDSEVEVLMSLGRDCCCLMLQAVQDGQGHSKGDLTALVCLLKA
jgi:hypothetical protein